jgi:hypothetical protein
MVSGVDSPVAQQNPLIEASTNVALVNQARQGAILNTSQLVVGKQFQAEVVASLEDGTYVVNVADVAARMQLPDSTQVGTKLSLTLISTSPRATFLLSPTDDDEAEATPTTTSATLGATVKQLVDDFNQSAKTSTSGTSGLYLPPGSNVTAVSNAPSDPRLIVVTPESPDSAPATLSTAGKLVNQLIQDTPQDSSIVNVSKVPVVSTPDVSVNTMAKALQGSVTNSGMFYESHLLQWAEGTLDVADLMKEPQASFPAAQEATPNAAQNNANQQGVQSNTPLANTQITGDGKIALPATSNPLSSNNTTTSATSTAITLPKDATPLIQQQLQTMEQQRFVWHGELWPGQSMEWEISRDPQGKKNGNPAEQTWQSAVNFELPQLGNISAQIQLTGTHLRLTVNARDATTALELQNHANELIGAMANTGTQLDSLLIKTRTAE